MSPHHTRHGYWLEEAGPVEARPPLDEDRDADVVIVGGGYLGMWTAWRLVEREPDLRVVLLEADVCGEGPSGRNGGFASAVWDQLPELRRRFGDAGAVAVAEASARAVTDVGAWCEEQGVDAWYRHAGQLQIATAPVHDTSRQPNVAAAAELGHAEEFVDLSPAEVRARCDSPVFRGGALMRAGGSVQPARLAHGLRARLLARGVEIHERTRVRRLVAQDGAALAETADGRRVRAGAGVLAINAAAAGIGPLRRRLTVASSHMVITEPVPDVLEQIGWTGGECIIDRRTFLHYFRTTPDGRIAFGWAGGRMSFGARTDGRMELDAGVIDQVRRDLVRIFPALEGRAVTHAWGGPIDVSPTHLPVFGTLPGGRVHYGFGFTGNGVAPTHLGGRILSALARDRRDHYSQLPIVEPAVVKVPPEPFRYAGGAVIRAAFLRRERIEEEGGDVDPVTTFVTSIPGRLGVHIGR